MRKFTVDQLPGGDWASFDVRGKMTTGPHAEEWMARLYGTHAACAPSLVKQLNLRKINGVYTGRPFSGVRVDCLYNGGKYAGWRAECTIDGERVTYVAHTRDAVLKLIAAHGRDIKLTRNILNPEAGDIEIDRASWGGCTDPGTERYHSM